MPIYEYKCQDCGIVFEQYSNIPTRNRKRTCKCGGKADRIICQGACRVSELMKDNPRWSDSMGINPDQLGEARKLFPDSTYDSEGRLLIKNRQHKLYEMKRRGLIERG